MADSGEIITPAKELGYLEGKDTIVILPIQAEDRYERESARERDRGREQNRGRRCELREEREHGREEPRDRRNDAETRESDGRNECEGSQMRALARADELLQCRGKEVVTDQDYKNFDEDRVESSRWPCFASNNRGCIVEEETSEHHVQSSILRTNRQEEEHGDWKIIRNKASCQLRAGRIGKPHVGLQYTYGSTVLSLD